MRILVVSAEATPFAKVGGLADVAGSLPRALRKLGHDARLVMPLYKMIEEDSRFELTTRLECLAVDVNPFWCKSSVYKETKWHDVPVGFVGTDEWFTESDDSESVYRPGGVHYVWFARAVIRAMEQIDWIPDLVHLNDWHTGFMAVMLREQHPKWNKSGIVYTIHNLAYQGEFGQEMLDAAGLSHTLFNSEATEAWGRVNFLKTGCSFADHVSTVSPNYAQEIQTSNYGCGLQGLMQHLNGQGKLSGILNGLDVEEFDPGSDGRLVANFSYENLPGKVLCREWLCSRLGLGKIEGPIFGVVSRLSAQKGLDLVSAVADEIVSMGAGLAILGTGDEKLSGEFRALSQKHPTKISFVDKFDVALAQEVYAGCDAFLMPSRFEPCGLGQLIAMRYGTVPVVRATGGLKDTVNDGINGFVFADESEEDFLGAISRAASAFRTPMWREIMHAGMSGDYTWDASAKSYASLFASVSADRLAKFAKFA